MSKELPVEDSLADLQADDPVYPNPDLTLPEFEENDDPDYDEANDNVDESVVGEPWDMGERP